MSATWEDGSQGARTLSALERRVTPDIRMSNFAAIGDGFADDYAPLSLATTTAIAQNRKLVLEHNKVYGVGTTWTIPGKCIVECNGATIKHLPSVPTLATVTISGNEVKLIDPLIDGNKAAGGGNHYGINSTGIDVELIRGEVFGCTATGIYSRAPGNLICSGTHSHDHFLTFSANGFYCAAGAGLDLLDFCRSEYNSQNGAWYDLGAQVRPTISLLSYRNGSCGMRLYSDDGRVDYFISDDDDLFGLLATTTGMKGWSFAYALCRNTGRTAGSGASTAVELMGARNFSGRIDVKGAQGYGVALASGCLDCTLTGSIEKSSDMAIADPGLHLSGGSKRNSLRYTIRNATIACILGEGTNNNDHNKLDLDLYDCSYAALHVGGGSHNRFRIRAHNILNTATPANFKAFLNFNVVGAGPVRDNVVEWFECTDDRGVASLTPKSVMWCDSLAVNNKLLDGIALNHWGNALVDDNGSNSASFRHPKTRSTLANFETTEAWSAGAVDTVAGHFAQGTQGRSLVALGASGTTTSMTLNVGPLDLSTSYVLNDWMRIRLYIQNVASALQGGPGCLKLYLRNSASVYFVTAFASAELVNGVNYLQVRPSEWGVNGSPSWSSISSLRIDVVSGSAPDFTVTFDEWVVLDDSYGPSREWNPTYPTCIADQMDYMGTGSPVGVLTAARVGANYRRLDDGKLWVMEAAGWVVK